MKFNHIPAKTPIIESAHNDTGHYYSIDGQTYPSITTILHSFPNKGIEIWKARTPNWRDIQNESLQVGTSLHSFIENYLNNEEYIPIESYSFLTGLISGYEWEFKSIETQIYKPNEKATFTADGVLKWNLFGINVYSEYKTYSGIIK